MRNLELKCHYPDLKQAERIAIDVLHARLAGCLQQTDVYFDIDHGRLKLRHNRFSPVHQRRAVVSHHELIYYQRPDQPSARTSIYRILPIEDGPAAVQFFTCVFGLRARVRKSRRLLLRENLRIHLDSVRGLGKFLEFELIVSPGYGITRCRRQMQELIHCFGIKQGQIVAGSYSELIMHQSQH